MRGMVWPVGNISPVPLWKGEWERVVVSAVMQMLDYLQILFSFPSSALCLHGLVIFNFMALTVVFGISKYSVEFAVYSEI